MLNYLFPLSTLPRRVTLKIIRLTSMWVTAQPSTNRVVSAIVNRFPTVKIGLERLGYDTGQTTSCLPATEEDIPMSSQVRAIYLDLMNSINKEGNVDNRVEKD